MHEPEAASRPERRISLAFDVFAVSQRLGAYLDRALAGTGIRPSEYAVYSVMLEAGLPIEPDIPVELGVDDYAAGRDPVREAAVTR
jgi:hypothetical protein